MKRMGRSPTAADTSRMNDFAEIICKQNRFCPISALKLDGISNLSRIIGEAL
jgi:hypothetical protein